MTEKKLIKEFAEMIENDMHCHYVRSVENTKKRLRLYLKKFLEEYRDKLQDY